MPLPTNPYIAGNPVGGGPAFIGRDDVLREVLRVLRRAEENAIVLYGQRRIGKTSILQHLVARLPAEGPYCPVYFDLQDKAEQSLERVLGVLAQTIAAEVGEGEGEGDRDRDRGEGGEIGEEVFRREWLPGVLKDLPKGHSLVLLFDEFDVLTDVERVARPTGSQSAAARLFPYLRELLAADRARLQFVFVVGRNVDDLTTGVLQLFKGTPAKRVSLLDERDTASLARLSEKNGTLHWPDDAVARVWQLTHGHPFLTQMLCSQIWELLYEDDPEEPPTVTPQSVEKAVDAALDASKNTLEWLWNGLGPAERVVASALAEAGPGPITQEQLEQVLQNSGVRVLIRELLNAPKLLQEWDILETADGAPDRYRFRVELLRRWLQANKPLRRVQDDLDRVQPLAENLYQAAYSFYQTGQAADALSFLQRAVAVNPNHTRATLLLTDLLLAQGQAAEAATLLERLYDYHPAAAKSSLLRVWLAQAQAAPDDDARLAFYAKVLHLEPTQPEAAAGTRAVWQQRGDAAMKRDDLAAALDAYRRAGLRDKVEEITRLMQKRELAAGLQAIETLEHDGKYQDALEREQALAKKFPKARAWTADLERLERKTKLDDLYKRAVGAWETGDRDAAQQLLAEIVELEPSYRETTRYLHLLVTGVDIADVQADLEKERQGHQKTQTQLTDALQQLERERHAHQQTKAQLGEIRDALQQNQTLLQQFSEQPWWKRLVAAPPKSTARVSPTPSSTVETPLATSAAVRVPSPSAGDVWSHPVDGKAMVRVPAGEFIYQNGQKKTLPEFWIDKTPVTNGEYKHFLDANPKHEVPSGWNQKTRMYPSDKGDHPVVSVSWHDAAAYVEWAGKRLPIEEEWEKAARGTDGRLYPWGEESPNKKLCNFNQNEGGTTPVGKYSPQGDSPYGCVDMAGNVWEWTASDYDKDNKVLRGGSWWNYDRFVTATSRSGLTPTGTYGSVGFRCTVARQG